MDAVFVQIARLGSFPATDINPAGIEIGITLSGRCSHKLPHVTINMGKGPSHESTDPDSDHELLSVSKANPENPVEVGPSSRPSESIEQTVMEEALENPVEHIYGQKETVKLPLPPQLD